jgi:uncharacterized protein (DUF4415 family)
MTGSVKKMNERAEILKAMKSPPPGGYFVWDGVDERDRPATAEEMQAGIEAARKGRGRPAGSGNKEQVAIRFDHDVLAAFRAAGPGWQTRMNAALRDWLKSHSPV